MYFGDCQSPSENGAREEQVLIFNYVPLAASPWPYVETNRQRVPYKKGNIIRTTGDYESDLAMRSAASLALPLNFALANGRDADER